MANKIVAQKIKKLEYMSLAVNILLEQSSDAAREQSKRSIVTAEVRANCSNSKNLTYSFRWEFESRKTSGKLSGVNQRHLSILDLLLLML